MITSKVEGLNFLKRKIKASNVHIPTFISKKVFYVKNNKKKFINQIIKKFKSDIIIRSSAYNEDNKNNSNAGLYLSKIVKFNQFNNIEKYLDIVIDVLLSKKDKIIIQQHITDINLSGVLFTREINKSTPYFVINYDTSKKTDLITSGKINPSIKHLYIYKETTKVPKQFKLLISIVKKLEKKLKYNDLDIEFAIKNKKLYIFQCRYLKQVKKNSYNFNAPLINLYKKIKKISFNPFLSGEKTVFSNMTDWNPAEMIGTKPKILSMSLYKTLITDEIWSIQRKNYGYKDVRPNKLMYNFLGSPYIDVKTDLNSFLPKNLNNKLSKKIINFSINKLASQKELHDKVEFEIIETFYNFDTKKKLQNFLNKSETKEYCEKLLKLTNNIILNDNLLSKDINKINSLRNKIDEVNSKKISEIQKIYFIIDIAKEFGTLPFAGIARCAFISSSLLKTLRNLNILTDDQYKNFFRNLSFLKNYNKKYSKKAFLKIYGHMRPSNYSISTFNYKENYKKYFGNKANFNIPKKVKLFSLTAQQKKEISYLIKKNKFSFRLKELLIFLKKSIYFREKAKIQLIYSIDKIFENLIRLGKEIKISREDLENLDIRTIINSYENLEFEKLKNIINKSISINKSNYYKNQYIVLPDVIINEKDIYSFYKENSKGNFITQKKIDSNIILYTKKLNLNKLKNKIICIENADPGYDFIFNYNISGLITKYGGANSHMSIRCLEKDIPACIGVGENFFENLNYKKKIHLDCKNYIIRQLH